MTRQLATNLLTDLKANKYSFVCVRDLDRPKRYLKRIIPTNRNPVWYSEFYQAYKWTKRKRVIAGLQRIIMGRPHSICAERLWLWFASKESTREEEWERYQKYGQ